MWHQFTGSTGSRLHGLAKAGNSKIYGPNQRIPRCQENRGVMLARAGYSRACGTGFTGSRDLLQSKLSGFTAYGPNQRIPRCQEVRGVMLARAGYSQECGTGFTGFITHKFADPWHGPAGFRVYHGFS